MYLLVLDGVAALWVGGVLGALGVGLVLAGTVASAGQARLRASLARVRGGETLLGLVAAVAALGDVVYVATSVLDALVHLLLFLLLYRLFTRRTVRDVRDVGFLCFFMLVAAAPGTFDVGFLFVFLAFVVLGTWALMLGHVMGEASEAVSATVTGHTDLPARRLLVLSLAAAAGTLVITAALFFVIPRIGQATLPLRMKVTRMVSGFSDRVSLGAFGEIETDAAVVMRVHVPEGAVQAPEQLAGLRWRGIALDRFDGTAWTREEHEPAVLRRGRGGTFDVSRPRGTGLYVPQEIYLEPLGTQVLFAAPRALRVTVRSDVLMVDDSAGLSVPSAAARLRYTVDSELEPLAARPRADRRVDLDPDARARYLQLPPVASRVRDLAREVTGTAPDAWSAAGRLTAFLAQRYRYSRVLDRQTSLPPVEEFLFVTRAGNCEYFAASLAVLLRTAGIPARVVNGFQRGEWNPYGRYFMVRLLDAHSWVEAHIDGAGWVTLDPSPRGGQEAAAGPGPVNLYLDALRLRWYRYVVNWSFQDQVTAAGKVKRAAVTWSPSLDWLRDLAAVRTGLLGLLGIAVAVALAAVWRLGPGVSRATRARSDPPRFYARALRVLARRGLRPAPAETAREFEARVGRQAPDLATPLARLTSAYERVRFGETAVTAEEQAVLDASVARLAAP
jgi:transglutaminase-like putative cysteine protease